MSSPVTRVGRRGTVMAIACVGAITASMAAMWGTGKDAKQKEGVHSPYRRGGEGGSDIAMTSSDINAAVSVPRPGKDRLMEQFTRTTH
ncbi:hypothetical protein BDQ17DRAFT_1347584, partial [Cyathus striatus]